MIFAVLSSGIEYSVDRDNATVRIAEALHETPPVGGAVAVGRNTSATTALTGSGR
jgi:hypothetical protein